MINSTRNFFRLCRKRSISQNKRFIYIKVADRVEIWKNSKIQHEQKKIKSLLATHKEKIVFNSHLEHEKLELGYFKYYLKTLNRAKKTRESEYKEKCLPPLPISLQYYLNKEKLLDEDTAEIIFEEDKKFQLPFAQTKPINIDEHDQKLYEESQIGKESDSKIEFDKSDIAKWMTNYEDFDDSKFQGQENGETLDTEWNSQYGTPDPTVAVSRVPCGGCGALLHCTDPAIPGYLPKELFKHRLEKELKMLECQRCHFLKEYNIALDVSVQPEEYEKLLVSIRHVKSLVILMVDLLDFPCSIWPGIVDIIGTDRPIIIVGNKVDLLPGDSFGYLKRIRESLIAEIHKTKLGEANIKHVALISAKTGYGVEGLISAMFRLWLYKGDVFLVGCTNVGKSSLFNALLQSDYCKVHAVDIVKRATVSRWPGTTLNLLKFPINRPTGWKMYERKKRLIGDAELMKTEKQIRNAQTVGKAAAEAPALIGHIGRSFTAHNPYDENSNKRMTVLDEKHDLFKRSKWFYDTPGVVHPEQMLSLLSTEELLDTIPKNLIRPQTYYLYKGSTIFIGGLARFDYVDSPYPCRFTIFCSECLPITVTKTEDADEVYKTFIGTELFLVPSGGVDRLLNWPGLKQNGSILEFTGEGPKQCCGDIVLSSIAWVGVTAKAGTVCKVAAWTPEGRGIHRRCPSVLPYAINLKGKRIQDTPAYMIGNVFSEEE